LILKVIVLLLKIDDADIDNFFTAFGTIHDKLGNPIAGVMISLGNRTVMTNDAGYWEIPSLQEGEYTITANKAPYTFTPIELALGNEEFKQKVVIVPLSALKVKVFTEPRKPKQGENITLIANITNGGNEIATGVVLTDVLPKGFRLISIEALDGGECNADTVTCTLPDLAPGTTAKVKLVVSNTEAKSSVMNMATVTSNEYPTDVHQKRVKIIPHLSVSCNCTPKKVLPEGELNCTAEVILSALAPIAATNVKLMVMLPKGVALQLPVNSLCDISEFPMLTCSLRDLNIDSTDATNRAIVSFD
jgi:uncharacterized repeat protein (TIGR01451 family)